MTSGSDRILAPRLILRLALHAFLVLTFIRFSVLIFAFVLIPHLSLQFNPRSPRSTFLTHRKPLPSFGYPPKHLVNPWSQFSPFVFILGLTVLVSQQLVLVPDLSSCHCPTFLHYLYSLRPRHRSCNLAMSHTTAPWSTHICYIPARLQCGPGYSRSPRLGKPLSHFSFEPSSGPSSSSRFSILAVTLISASCLLSSRFCPD